MSLQSDESQGRVGEREGGSPPAEGSGASGSPLAEEGDARVPLAGGAQLCLIEWDQIRDVEGLLQWTMNQLQPLHLWEMPALVERDWNHILNPVRKDSSKQTTILVKHVLDSLEKMQIESKTWQLEQLNPIVDAEIRDKILSQLTGKDCVGPCAYLCTLGRYNVGKTLLINALLSADVLPTSQDAETAVVVYIQHYERNEVPVLYNYSDGIMLCEGVDSIREYLKKVQRDVRLSRALSKQEYLVRIRIGCFNRPSASLNKQQHWRTITPLLVDTPGSNEVSQKDLQSIAHLNLQTAAAYIYVMTFFDLRNNHDYAAFGKILWKDKDIFRDNRVVIVVTRMDDQKEEVRESERLSDGRVKQIVSEGIKTALDLDFVSPDIVFPVSGKLAFQVREFGKDKGVIPLDELKRSWGNIHRSTLGYRAYLDASSMTSEELCHDLEQASQLAALESRIGMMIDKLDYIWKRSTATNCLLAIDQALVSLNNIHDALDKEVQRFKQTIEDCESVRQLHRHILGSLQQEDSELSRNLHNMYMSDTLSANVVDKREMRELIDDFIADIRGKAERGNYLPGDLRNDLSKFREEAHCVLINVCLETKFEYCHKLIMAYVMTMSESYGRLRKTLSDLLCQNTGVDVNSALNIVTGSISEAFGTNEPPRLDQITTEHIQVPTLKYILFGVSMIFGGRIHVKFISNEDIQVVHEDIKDQLKDAHHRFFTEIQSMITLHFFKQYCQQVVAMMRKFPCSLDGFADVESNAKDNWRQKEEQRDMCKCWIDELKSWQRRLLAA